MPEKSEDVLIGLKSKKQRKQTNSMNVAPLSYTKCYMSTHTHTQTYTDYFATSTVRLGSTEVQFLALVTQVTHSKKDPG